MSAPQRPGPPPPWPPQQPYGRQGETEWIPRVQEPRPDEPFRFEEPPPEQPGNPAALWAMRIAGLVAVALISGFLWAYLQSDDKNPTPSAGGDKTNEVPDGRFDFTAHPDMPEPKVDQDCAANSRDKIRTFFENHPCVKLTRALYTSTPPGQDKTIYTWVAVVEMDSTEAASQLHDLAHEDGSGNVTDPIIAGIANVEGFGKYGLGGGGYQSQLNGSHVIIVESDWSPSGDRTSAQRDFLKDVSADAIRYGTHFLNQG